MLYFIIGIIAAPILWFIFKVVTGFTVPPAKSGKVFLVKQLRAKGVPGGLIIRLDDGFIDRVVADCIETAETSKEFSGEGFTTEFCKFLGFNAGQIAFWLRGGEPNSAGDQFYLELKEKGLVGIWRAPI